MTKMKNANIRHYAELAAKNGNKVTKADIAIKYLKIAYYIALVAAVVTCLSMMIGNMVWMSELKNASTPDEIAKYNENKTQLITMIIAVFSLVSTAFLLKFKLCIPLGIVSCVECVLVFTTLFESSVNRVNDFYNEGLKSFLVLAIPSVLVAGVGVALAVLIFITYKLRVPKIYDKIVNALYQSHSKNGEVKLSAEEFEDIMNNYDGSEIFRTDIPLKKSVKRRKEQQDNK